MSCSLDSERILPVSSKYLYFLQDDDNHDAKAIAIPFLQQEGHDGPLSLQWLILGNLLKSLDPEEGLILVAMSSNKKISKYFTK